MCVCVVCGQTGLQVCVHNDMRVYVRMRACVRAVTLSALRLTAPSSVLVRCCSPGLLAYSISVGSCAYLYAG